jgi:hypothetical protein
MTRLARRAALVAGLLLLTTVETVYPECAWVFGARRAPSDVGRPVGARIPEPCLPAAAETSEAGIRPENIWSPIASRDLSWQIAAVPQHGA